jgi:hypothetical protein
VNLVTAGSSIQYCLSALIGVARPSIICFGIPFSNGEMLALGESVHVFPQFLDVSREICDAIG